MNIRFNVPYISGGEIDYIRDCIEKGRLSGNGEYTKMCQDYFVSEVNASKALMTTSCTDALEMCAILAGVGPGDEVIIPSYTFVSTANAFVRQGAKVVFADSRSDHPNIDEGKIESLITERTRAIVPVHYGGAACNMGALLEIAEKHGLFLIEDAAQAIKSHYRDRPLGCIGDFGAFSFHETKNIVSGEGGMLVLRDELYKERAEIIWEKGTNRAAFYRGQVDKYTWVDVGSSFLPSDMISAFLWSQLEAIDHIQELRLKVWDMYFDGLRDLQDAGSIELPSFMDYQTNNAHVFYILLDSLERRDSFLEYMKKEGISAVFHYLALHDSPFYRDKHDGRKLDEAVRYTSTLVRLPLYPALSYQQVNYIIDKVHAFFK